MNSYKHPLRVGVGGPVGSGKTALLEALCKAMRDTWQLAVVTNDIYTKEDQRILTEAGALAPERIVGVETGGCPLCGRVAGGDGERYPAYARRSPMDLHQSEAGRRPEHHYRLPRRQRHAWQIGLLHQPGASASGWCSLCSLFISSCLHLRATPALQYGIRFANSSHA